MFTVRNAKLSDLEGLFAVAKHLDTVNLPANRDALQELLQLSDDSFHERIPVPEREFIFVLVDGDNIVGSSMIHAQHGTRRSPHIFFRVQKEERCSETLDAYFVHEVLQLGYDYNGPTEIGGLILLPEYRNSGKKLGKLLSYVRFLFMAMNRSQFREQVLSELLPPLQDDDSSLLWSHLGRRFTGLSYQAADQLSKKNKEFIRSLFPHRAIYTSLFPQNVRDVIGRVGPDSLPVEKILRRIGFTYANQIDPFDGGPHFIANTDEITLVKNAREVTLCGGPPGPHWGIVAQQTEDHQFWRQVVCFKGRTQRSHYPQS